MKDSGFTCVMIPSISDSHVKKVFAVKSIFLLRISDWPVERGHLKWPACPEQER